MLRDAGIVGENAVIGGITKVNAVTGERTDIPLAPGVVSGAIKPPDDAGVTGWTWQSWKKEADLNSVPGWAYCRFVNRLGPTNVGFVFGIVRSSFGIWAKDFATCTYDPATEDVEQKVRRLYAVTHLPSGGGLGLFDDRMTATLACEIGEKLNIDWSTVDADDPKSWGPSMAQTAFAWHSMGISHEEHSHVHVDSFELPIWTYTDGGVDAGKPKVLS